MKKKFLEIIIATSILFSLNVNAKETNHSQNFDYIFKRFDECQSLFDIKKQKCSETGSFKCYEYLTALHHEVQNCYIDLGTDIFVKFYNQKNDVAHDKLNKFVSFAYDNYFFIYAQTNFCNENNCGISPYLYSEYATTDLLKDYIERIISSLIARQ